MNSVMLPNVLSYVYINRSQAASMTHVKTVTVAYDSTNTSGKMVTQQQNWLDLRGAGELHLGLDQLGEAGSFGIAMPSLQKQSKFPLIKMALYQHLSISFLCTQPLLFNSIRH